MKFFEGKRGGFLRIEISYDFDVIKEYRTRTLKLYQATVASWLRICLDYIVFSAEPEDFCFKHVKAWLFY